MKEGCRESVKEEGKTRNSGANVNTPKQGISSGLQLEAQITLSKNTQGTFMVSNQGIQPPKKGLHIGQMAALETSLVAYNTKCKL